MAEYLILNAELSLRGMVLPIAITRDFKTFDESRLGHIMPESFVIISRARYIEECRIDGERALKMTQPLAARYSQPRLDSELSNEV